ncbi:MAG: GAF domain-containing protein [Gammaproteobacteria bacterium]
MPDAPPPPARRLGAYLLCSPALIRTALGRQNRSLRQPRSTRRLGELLVAAGAVSPAELDIALRAQRTARLRACPLFAALTGPEIAKLATRFDERSVAAGEQFIAQGDADPTLYVLASGALEVFRVDGAGLEVPLAVVHAGEPIGEMGYFSGGVRTASVRALEASEMLRASYDDLTHYFENVPHVAHAFVTVVQRRRDDTRRTLSLGAPARPAALVHLAGQVDLAAPQRLRAGMRTAIERLVHAAAQLTDADRASLFLIDAGTGELWSTVAMGLDQDEIRIAPGSGIAGWVVAHGESINSAEANEDPRFDPQVDLRTGYRTRTVLCVPVRDASGAAVGAIEVVNKRLGTFSEDDEHLLRAFGDQLAVAVENTERQRRTVRDYELLALLLEVATLATQAIDLPWFATRLAERLEERLGCERCELFVADAQADDLWTARRSEGRTVTNRYALSALPAGTAALEGAIVRIADAGAEIGYDPAAMARAGAPVRNVIAVPVRNAGREVVAVLQAVNKAQGEFTAADEKLLAAVGTQIGLARMLSG